MRGHRNSDYIRFLRVGLFSLTLLVSALPETGYACPLREINRNLLGYLSQAVFSICNGLHIISVPYKYKMAVGPTAGQVVYNQAEYAQAAKSLMLHGNVPVPALIAAEDYVGDDVSEESDEEIDRGT